MRRGRSTGGRGRVFGLPVTGVIVLVTWAIGAPLAFGRAGEEGPPSVELAQGRIGSDEWAAFVEGPEPGAKGEANAVCLVVGYFEPFPGQTIGEGNEVAQCGPLATGEVMLESYTSHRKGRPARTAVAFVAGGEAQRMRLKLKGEPVDSVRLRHLSETDLGPIGGGRRLSYFARGYAKPFCLQSLVLFDQEGRRVASLKSTACH
jgi:hypothetical protein